MSGECPTTGFDHAQQNRWPYVHQFLCDKLELGEQDAFDAEFLARFSQEIDSCIEKSKPSESTRKRRKSLFQHLQRTIEHRFKGSTLRQFGSSESGLSLSHGDLDLCLVSNTEKPKKILRSLSKTLRNQDMEDIQVIASAKVPIIKFRDERTKIPVDISINNTLALHNTNLLKRYGELDSRIKQCILAIKYWASQRDVCNAAEGTFSSYAWTLIMLQNLQTTTPPVAPNIQGGEQRTLLEVDGIEYDLTMSDNPNLLLKEKNSQSVGELLVHFFKQMVVNRPWDNHVIAVRNGKPISRQSKAWKYAKPHASDAVLMGGKTRLGLHSFPVEDPFDHAHDLSRVLRPEGALDIQEEMFRFWIGLKEGKGWEELCEFKHPERRVEIDEKDLFEDLRKLSKEDISKKVAESESNISELEQRIEALNQERQNNIKISQALRGIFEETSDLRNEHRQIVRGLKPRQQRIQELTQNRDAINQRIGIPLYRIREMLVDVYQNLTGDVDMFQVPSLEREEQQFSWFFELQAMHNAALEADSAHKELTALLKEQKSAVKELKISERKQSEVKAEILKSEPLLADIRTEFSEAKQHDKNANSLKKVIQERRKELRRERREKGRIDAWIRISSNPGAKSRRRKGQSKRDKKTGQADWKPKFNKPKIEDVKQRAESGNSLSLMDIDVLLQSGGVSSIQNSKPSQKSKRRADRKKKQNLNLSARRGERSQSKKGRKD